MDIPGTQPIPGKTPPDPRARGDGDRIGAEIGDGGDGSQIAVGKDIQQTTVHTGGGTYVGRDVNTGGDFIAGDKNVHIENYWAVGEGGKTPPPNLDPLSLYRAPRPATLFGRDELTVQIVAELTDPTPTHTALALTALRGLPGVGKSALAL